MSILRVTNKPPAWAALCFKMGTDLVKQAGDPELVYNLSGRLYKTPDDWIMLSVPNALVRGVFAAMTEPGIELPPQEDGRDLNAHISVIRSEEVAQLGGGDKITERGKQYTYTLGRIYSVEPEGWPEMSKVWYIKVHSPELQALRRSYGLSGLPSDGKFDFHISVAVRRKKVLGRNDTSKAQTG